MPTRFSVTKWDTLTVGERIDVCSLFAQEAQLLAETAPPALKEHYLKLAQQWLMLAGEIAHTRFN